MGRQLSMGKQVNGLILDTYLVSSVTRGQGHIAKVSCGHLEVIILIVIIMMGINYVKIVSRSYIVQNLFNIC